MKFQLYYKSIFILSVKSRLKDKVWLRISYKCTHTVRITNTYIEGNVFFSSQFFIKKFCINFCSFVYLIYYTFIKYQMKSKKKNRKFIEIKIEFCFIPSLIYKKNKSCIFHTFIKIQKKTSKISHQTNNSSIVTTKKCTYIPIDQNIFLYIVSNNLKLIIQKKHKCTKQT